MPPTTSVRADRSILRRVLAPLLVVLALVAGPLAFTPAAQAADGSISGLVTGQGGESLPYTQVTVYRDFGEGNFYYWTSTYSLNGTYSVSVPEGTYRLEFSGPDRFAHEFYDGASSLETATSIVVDGAETGKDAELATLPAITGKLRGADGAPLAFGDVTAYQLIDEDWQEVASAYTDVAGSYVLYAPAGSYKVKFADGNYVHRSEFYNNKTTAGTADAVVLGAAANTPGIDAQLALRPTIAGTVTSGGNGLSGIRVEAYSVSDRYDQLSSTMTKAGGAYAVPVDPDGAYVLKFVDQRGTYRAEYWDDKGTAEAAAAITVASASVTGKNASLTLNPTITGTVTSAAGAEVESATVTAYRLSDGYYQYVREVQTGVDGRYRLPVETGGPYTLRFGHPDYRAEYFDDAATQEEATSFSVTGSISGRNATLAPRGGIKGVVSGPSGPARVQVTAYRLSDLGGESYWQSWSSVQTSISGAYTMRLDPGQYRLGFRDYSGKLSPEYYQDATTVETGTSITVGDSGDRTADATLAASPTISGTLTGGGNPLEYATVGVYRADAGYPGGYVRLNDVETDSTGAFSVGAPPGTYKLAFDADGFAGEFYDNQPTLAAASEIVVAMADVTNRNAALEPAARLKGTITADAGGAPLPDAYVSAEKRIVQENGSTYWNLVSETGTSASGTYSMALSPGTYRLRFGSAGGYRTEFYDNVTDPALATVVALGSSDITADASLAKNPTVSGRVTRPGGAGLPEIGVSLLAEEFDGVGMSWEEVESTETAADGTYAVAAPAGSYKLRFRDYEGGFKTEYYNNVATVDDAAVLTVPAGGLSGRDAELAPNGSISGRVTGPNGAGVNEGYVTAYKEYVYSDGQTSWEEAAYDETDASGSYSLKVPDGTYRIGFTADDQSLQREFWNDKPTVEQGTDVVVSGDAVITGRDAQLAAGSGVKGSVTIPGEDHPDTYVRAYQQDADGAWKEVGSTYVSGYYLGGDDEMGAYQLPLRPGTYKLKFSTDDDSFAPLYYDQSATFGASTSVVVSSGVFRTGINASFGAGQAVTSSAAPSISGTPTVGSTLTANDGSWGPSGVTLTRQWYRDGEEIADATGPTYLLTSDDLGARMSLRVKGAKSGLLSLYRTSARTAQVTSSTPPVTNSVTPSITGTPTFGRTLTANLGTWAPEPVVKAVQWLRNGVPINGATASTYTLGVDDVGMAISLRVTGTASGSTLVRTSPATASVAGAPLTSSPVPTISGTPTVGSTLTVNDGAWGPAPVVLTHRWLRDGVATGQSGDTYVLGNADNGTTISVETTGTKPGYTTEQRISSGVPVSPAGTPSVTNTVLPSISGAATVGQTLQGDLGTWGPGTVDKAPRWLRNGTPITGATGSSYVLTPGDLAAMITLEVTGTRAGHTPLTRASTATAAVMPGTLTSSAPPSISGTATVGQTLTGNQGSWAPEPVTKAPRWLRNGQATGTTGTSYTLTAADQGAIVTLEVTGTKVGYLPLVKTSAPTTPVAAAPVVVGPPAPPAAQPPAIAKVNPTIKVVGKGAKKKATLTITVRAPGVTPTGRITIKLGNKKLKTVTLKGGKAKVVLTKQKKGKKAYKVSYAGDNRVNARTVTSKKIPIR